MNLVKPSYSIVRATLTGYQWTVELLADGTGRLRKRENNSPTSLTSHDAATIEQKVRKAVDEAVTTTAPKPAVWPAD